RYEGGRVSGRLRSVTVNVRDARSAELSTSNAALPLRFATKSSSRGHSGPAWNSNRTTGAGRLANASPARVEPSKATITAHRIGDRAGMSRQLYHARRRIRDRERPRSRLETMRKRTPFWLIALSLIAFSGC